MRNPALTSAVVASVFRGFRERAGISQDRLAALADVDRTYVGKLERRVLKPSVAKLDQLLEIIGITWAEFGAALDRELEAANENRAAGRARRPPGRRAP